MTGKEKEAVARAIATSLRGAPIPGFDEELPAQRAQANRIREALAMQLGEDLGALLGGDAETMALYYDSAGLTVEVHRG